jgi:hypothetical protein
MCMRAGPKTVLCPASSSMEALRHLPGPRCAVVSAVADWLSVGRCRRPAPRHPTVWLPASAKRQERRLRYRVPFIWTAPCRPARHGPRFRFRLTAAAHCVTTTSAPIRATRHRANSSLSSCYPGWFGQAKRGKFRHRMRVGVEWFVMLPRKRPGRVLTFPSERCFAPPEVA